MEENSQLILVAALIVTLFTTIIAAIFLFINPDFWRSREKTSIQPAEVDPKKGEKLIPFYEEQYKNLEKYLEDNRRQNWSIYRLTLVFISAGFAIIILGVSLNILTEKSAPDNGSWIVIASGVITEFIAATLLVVYRSVFQQTTEYFRVLERFASVGMSINILDNLKDDTATKDNLKDDTATKGLIVNAKIEIAKKLLDRPGIVSMIEKLPSDNQPK